MFIISMSPSYNFVPINIKSMEQIEIQITLLFFFVTSIDWIKSHYFLPKYNCNCITNSQSFDNSLLKIYFPVWNNIMVNKEVGQKLHVLADHGCVLALFKGFTTKVKVSYTCIFRMMVVLPIMLWTCGLRYKKQ